MESLGSMFAHKRDRAFRDTIIVATIETSNANSGEFLNVPGKIRVVRKIILSNNENGKGAQCC